MNETDSSKGGRTRAVCVGEWVAGREPERETQATPARDLKGAVLFLVVLVTLAGILAGLLARFGVLARAIPGAKAMSVWEALLFGVIGSFFGAFVFYLLLSADILEERGGGLLMLAGGVLAVFVYGRIKYGSSSP